MATFGNGRILKYKPNKKYVTVGDICSALERYFNEVVDIPLHNSELLLQDTFSGYPEIVFHLCVPTHLIPPSEPYSSTPDNPGESLEQRAARATENLRAYAKYAVEKREALWSKGWAESISVILDVEERIKSEKTRVNISEGQIFSVFPDIPLSFRKAGHAVFIGMNGDEISICPATKCRDDIIRVDADGAFMALSSDDYEQRLKAVTAIGAQAMGRMGSNITSGEKLFRLHLEYITLLLDEAKEKSEKTGGKIDVTDWGSGLAFYLTFCMRHDRIPRHQDLLKQLNPITNKFMQISLEHGFCSSEEYYKYTKFCEQEGWEMEPQIKWEKALEEE